MKRDVLSRSSIHRLAGGGVGSQFANPVLTTVDGLVDTLRTHSWALTAEPAEREAAFDRLRAYLATRSETASGEFELPLVTDVVRALRR